VIGTFRQLVHPQNRLPGVIKEHQAPLLPDNAEKLIYMKTHDAVCKQAKLKTINMGSNTFFIHVTQKTKIFAMQQLFRYPVPGPVG